MDSSTGSELDLLNTRWEKAQEDKVRYRSNLQASLVACADLDRQAKKLLDAVTAIQLELISGATDSKVNLLPVFCCVLYYVHIIHSLMWTMYSFCSQLNLIWSATTILSVHGWPICHQYYRNMNQPKKSWTVFYLPKKDANHYWTPGSCHWTYSRLIGHPFLLCLLWHLLTQCTFSVPYWMTRLYHNWGH